MKGACIALLIALAILVVFLVTSKIYITRGTVDIQFHDTYFILSHASVLVFIILFLGTFFLIGGIIGTHFKSTAFWVLLVALICIDIYFILPFFKP